MICLECLEHGCSPREMTREDLGLPPELTIWEMFQRDHSDFYPPSLEEIQAILLQQEVKRSTRWQMIIGQP